MAILPCRLDDETGGTTHDAAGARHSGDSTVCGALIASSFSYLRDRTVRYTQASVDYADTIRARVAPLVWGGTPAGSNAGTVDRTTDTYHIFSLPAQGGTGTLYICGQAQWQSIGDTYDILGLEVLRQYEWTRYQIRGGCVNWTGGNTDPIVHLLAGNGTDGWSGDGGNPKLAAVSRPTSILPDPTDRTSFLIGAKGSVRRVAGSTIATIAGTGTFGHTGDGTATTTPIGSITGMAVDSHTGLLWFTDLSPRTPGLLSLGLDAPTAAPPVYPYNVTSVDAFFTGGHYTNRISDVSDTGVPYVPASGGWYNTLRALDLTAHTITTDPHTYTIVGTTDDGGGNPLPYLTSAGRSVLVNPDGTLLLSLFTPQRITRIGGPPVIFYGDIIAQVTIGTPAVSILNAESWYTNLISAASSLGSTAFSTNVPMQMAFGPDGSLYWADAGNNRISKRTTSGVYSVVYGVDATHPGSDLTHAFNPCGVALDAAGNLYIADTGNNRVLRKDAISGVAKVVCGVTGSSGATPEGSPGTATRLNHPTGLYVSPKGTLYICDRDNQRVLWMGCPLK